MKKIVLSVAAVFAFGFAAQAQDKPAFGFEQGNVFVEGNIKVNSKNDRNSEVKTNEFKFNPKVGYFLNDKFAVGASFEVGNDKITNPNTADVKGNNFYGGVFGRYYFLELGNRFKTYTEANVGYDSGKVADVKFDGIRAGLNLGFNYFLTDKVAVTFNLTDLVSYKSLKQDLDGAKSVSEFDANINVFNNIFNNATFGLVYKF